MNRLTYRGVQGEDTAHGYTFVKKAITLLFPYTIRKLFFRTPVDRNWCPSNFLKKKGFLVFPGGRPAGALI